MSIQFGRWNFDGKAAGARYLERVDELICPFGPDPGGAFHDDGIDILYRALHTTPESRLERQPYISQTGIVVTWDGRLDNRDDLLSALEGSLTATSADVSIVGTACERWGSGCFRKLVGDWALSIWNPTLRELLLARDFSGVRPLYYSVGSGHVIWSSVLDPLVLLAGHSLQVDEEYIAGWLSSFPPTHLAPFVGIRSVPPSCVVRLTKQNCTTSRYWDFDPGKQILYPTDEEYEEHFRVVFAKAVQRRLRSATPVLAELSGGMDSSAVVCMADRINPCRPPRIDTLSYYDDSEPNWDEQPYFAKVEEQRGRRGWHINVAAPRSFSLEIPRDRFYPIPGTARAFSAAVAELANCIVSNGYRVMLSGNGGDEVLGGVPDPGPELTDLLAAGRFATFARQLTAWALVRRKTLLSELAQQLRAFLPLTGTVRHTIPWLRDEFLHRQRRFLSAPGNRVKWFGPRPSFQSNLATLELLRRQLSCSCVPCSPAYECRYPFLDRDLLEFLYAIPRQQLLRPNQRRSLLRRALAGMVPTEILTRRRKAFLIRGPLCAIAANWQRIREELKEMEPAAGGIIDLPAFLRALEEAADGYEAPLVPLLRTIALTAWLQYINGYCGIGFPDEQFTETVLTGKARITPTNPSFNSAEPFSPERRLGP